MTTHQNTTTDSAETASTKSRKNHKKNSLLFIFALLVIVTIVYNLYSNHQLAHQVNQLITNSDLLKQQQNTATAKLDSMGEEFNTEQQALKNKLLVLNNKLLSSEQERTYQNKDWLLLKARYYLELAEINAHWSHDLQTSLALLNQADKLLMTIHEPQLFDIRQAIAKEQTEIQAIQTVDITGLLAELDAATESIAHLTAKNPFTLSKKTPSKNNGHQQASTWREHLENSLNLLKKLVIIQHHNTAIEPLMTSEYLSLVHESLVLNFQEAQWAVIQQNEAVYQLCLKQAINTIKRIFDLNSANTLVLLEKLQKLQKITFNSSKPTPGQSLILLNQLIESKKVLETKDNVPVSGENP